MEDKTYQIGGKIYIQRPLVLGQIRQFLTALKGVSIPTNMDAMGWIEGLEDVLPGLLAVVLTEEGQSPKEKNMQLLSEEISSSISLETTLQVIEDFFDCNPVPSLLEKFGKMTAAITKKMMEIGSMKSASSSREGTSQDVISSSGDSLQ